MYRYALAFAASFLVFNLAAAQSLVKEGVVKMKFRNAGEIIKSGQVNGYYFFLDMERTDKTNNNFQVAVYDENLREINSIVIKRPRSYVLVEGSFNGEAFGFMFYDPKAKSVELVGFDKTLKETGGTIKQVSNIGFEASLNSIASGAEPSQSYLVPVENQGFIYYGTKPGNKNLYFVEFLSNEMRRVWFNVCKNEENDTELASEAFQSGEYVGSVITKKRKRNSKDMFATLLVQNVKDGKVLFEKEMTDDKQTILLSSVDYNPIKKEIVVFGEYYVEGDRALRDQSQGFVTVELGLDGAVLNKKTNSWATEISNATPLDERGKFEGSNTNVLIHKSIRMSDGRIFVVGEQYKKAANAAGIGVSILSVAAAAATGGGYVTTGPLTQLNIYNMVLFEFKPDYSIEKVHVFEKDKNVVGLPSGSEYLSPKMVSYYAKSIGGFDYLFTQKPTEKDEFIVHYVNYDREKGEASGNVLGSIVYTPEKTFTVDKMKLKRGSTDYYIYNAKHGYVMVMEYSKKEKKVEARLEQINY
ncbi:MAG: DUF6770 family protein [Cyclobacteriaceae bacterium]